MNTTLEPPDLFSRIHRPLPTERARQDALLLEACLNGRRWIVKRILIAELGWTERRLQDAREHSDGAIISSSKAGYCLHREATLEELRDVLGEITRRLKTIGHGYSAIARRLHKNVKSSEPL
jgi:hypothetical protein